MPIPVSNFTATPNGSNFKLAWNSFSGASSYYIYRSTTGLDGTWSLLTNTTAITYTDVSAPTNSLYMVKSAILTTTACGSYYNLTQGVCLPHDFNLPRL